MSQRPDSVPHRPEGVSQRPGNVPQRPDILRFWQDIQDISGYPGGATARLRRALAPCRSSLSGHAQSARGRWLNARREREAAAGHRVSRAAPKPPLKCQHQQSGAAAGSPACVTKTEQISADRCAGSHAASHVIENDSGSLTLEGRRPDLSLGVQLSFSPVRGKRKESAGLVRWKEKGIRLESSFLSRFHRDFSRLRRDSAASVAIAEQSHVNNREIATDSKLHTCRKHGGDAGRMCEVGPPRRRGVPLHFPLFAPTALNGHPALRGIRRPPATT